MIDPITSLAFSMYENKGTYALLLGSGVSRAAHIPTGWEITLDLARRVATLEGVTGEIDRAAWYKKRFAEEPNYSKLLDLLASTPDERRSILHGYIEPSREELLDGKKTPTPGHKAIAYLVQSGFIRVIITTNFDRLIENALRELGIEPTVIASDDDLKGAVPLVHSPCHIIKVHGDYLDTRIRNTESELKEYSISMDTMLDRIFDEHGLIVCGWSAEWDPALYAAICRTPSRRYQMYWASRGDPTHHALDLVSLRRAKVLKIKDADYFFSN